MQTSRPRSLSEASGGPALANERVLVVDDEPLVREFLVRGLSRFGLDCQSAADADEALAAASAEPPALTITDIRMPGRDGVWLLKHMRRQWPDAAIIMLTGFSETKTAVHCMREGADDYVIKPVDIEELGALARNAIARRRTLRETREHQHDLERAMTDKNDRLRHALRLIDETYQCTLGALTPSYALEREVRDDAPPSRKLLPPSATGLPEPPTREGPEDDLEVALFRRVGDLMRHDAPLAEIASSVVTLLKEEGGVELARFWRRRRDSPRPTSVVSSGARGTLGLSDAEKALQTGIAQTDKRGGFTLLSVPVQVRGRAEGVLQAAWHAGHFENRDGMLDRVSGFLGAALARESEAEHLRKTVRELDLFCEMASATAYSLDLHHVAQFLMDSFHKVVDYDVAALLLVDQSPSLHIRSRLELDTDFINRVRSHILNTLRLTCGLQVAPELATRVSRIDGAPADAEAAHKLRSFINVPLSVEGSVAGLFHVSSIRENAFSDEEVLFLNRAANYLATTVQGVRHLLATVKSRIERMVEHMSDGLLMLDAQGEVVAMNDVARTLLKKASGPDAHVSVAEVSRLLEFDPLDLMRSEGRSLRQVVMIDETPYQVQLSPLNDRADELGVVVAFRNFTEEAKIDQMKSEFINIVSHEMRTPLTAVKNAVDLLTGPRLGAVNDNQARFLALARRNIEQLIVMINDLLDLSKIEAGKMGVDLRLLDPAECIRRAVAALHAQAEEKGVVLESELEANLPRIFGDEALLERVMVNLVGNALKFTATGGRVRVEASSESAERALRVTVSDTGVGIPEEHLESIFDKFHQIHRESMSGISGTGLGLPITRELVKAHHGRVWAESEPNRGSRFIVLIPVLSESELFFRNLTRELDRAAKTSTRLALIVFRLDAWQRLRAAVGEPRYQAILDAAKASAAAGTRRSTDRIELRREQGELVAVLPDTSRDGARAFAGRLTGELAALGTSFEVSDFDWITCVSMYPDDALTAEDLYRRSVITPSPA